MSGIHLLDTVRGYLVGASPGLVFWAAGLVFGIVVSRRDRSGAAGYLTAGAGVRIGAVLLSIVLNTLNWRDVVLSAANPPARASWWIAGDVTLNIINAAGILLLLYAFWLKVRAGRAATVRA